MPALLMVKANDSPNPDINTRYGRGMLVHVYPQNQPLGWMEIPVNPAGSFTVQQVNNSPSTPTIYSAFKMLDGGLVTKGAVDVPVVAGDVIVWRAVFLPDGEVDSGGWRFLNYGDYDDTPDLFYHLRIKDRTELEVQTYLLSLAKDTSYESLQYDPQNDNRRVRVANLSLTSSGENGFTDEGTQAVVDTWNGTRVSWSTTEFVIDAVLPPEVYDEFVESTEALARDDLYRIRRYYLNEAGMSALEANDGVISVTAAEFAASGYLQDAIDD